MATRSDVIVFIENELGPIKEKLSISDTAIVEAANMVQLVFKAPFADFDADPVRWHVLATFYAFNTALTYASVRYKFSADGATVEGNNIFTQIHQRWLDAASMAQGYLMDAGIIVTFPGAPAMKRSYGFRLTGFMTGYLTDDVLPTA